jgi:hypothetical protein
MAPAAMKAEYGPTLGGLLAPRWRAASSRARALAIGGAVLVLAVVIGLALTFENSQYSHSGRLPFSFSYRNLYRVAPEPGGYVRVQSRDSSGHLKYSFAVNPLLLPAHSGDVAVELPIYAAGYVRSLRGRYSGFELEGEGFARTSLHGLPGYEILYTATVEGRQVFGRDMLLLHSGSPATREGVRIVMLSAPGPQVGSAQKVGSTGVLAHPLKTFAFG